MVVEKNGFLLAVMVTVAHIHDSKAVLLLMRVLQESFHSIKTIIADGGYCENIINNVRQKFGYFSQIAMCKTSSNNDFKPVHKRWIVERTFSWFDNDRRLCRNYELLMESAEQMVKLSVIKFFNYD